MSRISTPATIAEAPEQSQPLLRAVNAQLGLVPNMFRLIATSPQTLEAYLGVSGGMGKGVQLQPVGPHLYLQEYGQA